MNHYRTYGSREGRPIEWPATMKADHYQDSLLTQGEPGDGDPCWRARSLPLLERLAAGPLRPGELCAKKFVNELSWLETRGLIRWDGERWRLRVAKRRKVAA